MDAHLVAYLGHLGERRNFVKVDVLMSSENNCLPLQWWQEADLYIYEETTLESNGIDTNAAYIWLNTFSTYIGSYGNIGSYDNIGSHGNMIDW